MLRKGTIVTVKPTGAGLRASYPAANWIEKPEIVRLSEDTPGCHSLDVVDVEMVLTIAESQMEEGIHASVYDFNIADPLRLPVIADMDHFNKVLDHARSRNLEQHFREQLNYLATYAVHTKKDRARMRCNLFPDFAPQSFYFEVQQKGTNGVWMRVMNGGLIYYAGCEDGVGDPQFSVRLGSRLGEGWEVHT